MERSLLAHHLVAASHQRGDVVARSGANARQCFDPYRFESDPGLLAGVARHLAALVPAGTEGLAGLELGGMPVVTALPAATGLPAVFVRTPATPYGTRRLAEGMEVEMEGRRLPVIEGVVTTGGQVEAPVTDLRARGAQAGVALCVVDRSGGDHPALDAAGIELVALCTLEQLPVPGPTAEVAAR